MVLLYLDVEIRCCLDLWKKSQKHILDYLDRQAIVVDLVGNHGLFYRCAVGGAFVSGRIVLRTLALDAVLLHTVEALSMLSRLRAWVILRKRQLGNRDLPCYTSMVSARSIAIGKVRTSHSTPVTKLQGEARLAILFGYEAHRLSCTSACVQ